MNIPKMPVRASFRERITKSEKPLQSATIPEKQLSAWDGLLASLEEIAQTVSAQSRFRHTYATLMAQAVGMNPFILKAVLGHEQISTTDRCCHSTAPLLTLEMPSLG